jgi:hypothetical protein
MGQIVGPELLVFNLNQTPGNYPKEDNLNKVNHDERLKFNISLPFYVILLLNDLFIQSHVTQLYFFINHYSNKYLLLRNCRKRQPIFYFCMFVSHVIEILAPISAYKCMGSNQNNSYRMCKGHVAVRHGFKKFTIPLQFIT